MLKIERVEHDRFSSHTFRVNVPEGTMYVIVMEDASGKPVGIQANIGKTGSAVAAWINALTRLCSLALDHGADIQELIGQLSANNSDRFTVSKDNIKLHSGPSGIAHVLLEYHRAKKRHNNDHAEYPPRLGIRKVNRKG